MLVSAEQRDEVAAAIRDIEKIETATDPRFQELFVSAMAFPHATAPSPHLAEVVTLPEKSIRLYRGERPPPRPAFLAAAGN